MRVSVVGGGVCVWRTHQSMGTSYTCHAVHTTNPPEYPSSMTDDSMR